LSFLLIVIQVIATGTKLTPPSTLPSSDKADGVTYLRNHASKVESSSNIAIIGGGAVGVQMATDIKEIYPEKDVTLIHSREQIMNKFHPQLDGIIKQRCEELGVKLKLGSRVKLPAKGYPTDGSTFNVELIDGSSVSTDFAVCFKVSEDGSIADIDRICRSLLLVKRHSQSSSALCHQSPSMMLVSCV
jgi:pyruvate/2-oxoglutarate dehydrogenase complex dihydrolipoamide dehydrogenase (E3) component